MVPSDNLFPTLPERLQYRGVIHACEVSLCD